jgi:LPPG:FO 2-phospho-L-lactate transferase
MSIGKTPTPDAGSPTPVIAALAGGVGGARLGAGLQAALPEGSLRMVVNTADDFRLWGLHISPDLDTVMYTLADLANPELGWGLAGDTWRGLEMIARYGEEPWFRIGDMDMATHVLRTRMLSEGRTLTEASATLAAGLGVAGRILPMCDEPVETLVETPEGTLGFQDYFVRRRHGDVVTGVSFEGIEAARPTPEVAEALGEATAIIFCPSNPIVSIGPILAVPGMAGLLERARSVKVAVSPIIGGAAVKGPAADMLRTMGHEVSPVGVAALYAGAIDGIVIDRVDEALASRIQDMGMEVEIADTIMRDQAGRRALAETVLGFCRRLGAGV